MLKALLRAYFMAHAPAEPQPWFRPVVSPMPSFVGMRPTDWTSAENREYDAWRDDYLLVENISGARVRAYVQRVEAHRKAQREHDALVQREAVLQWPRAWADEQVRRWGKA